MFGGYQGKCSPWTVSPMVWIPTMGALKSPSLLPGCVNFFTGLELNTCQPLVSKCFIYSSCFFRSGLELLHGLDSDHKALRNLSLLPGCSWTFSLASSSTCQPSALLLNMFCNGLELPHGLDSGHGGTGISLLPACAMSLCQVFQRLGYIAWSFSCVIQVQQMDVFWQLDYFNK